MIYLYKVGEDFLKRLKENDVFFKILKDPFEVEDYCIIVTEKRMDIKNRKVLAVVKPILEKVLKWDIRFKVWRMMKNKKVLKFPYDVFGRIPNFYGAEDAAKNLLKIKEFLEAETVFVNPDSPQRPARRLVLELGKRLIMASPRLKDGFILIEECGKPKEASTIKGAFKYGKKVQKVPKIDFMIQGSVAVDKRGYRLGKGSGYGDLEIKLIKEENPNVKIATTVHEIQIISKIPTEPHDERVDYIVTPKKVISCKEET